VTTETRTATVHQDASLSHRCHPSCIACGRGNDDGLGLDFVEQANGSVVGFFGCDAKYQGYPDRLHGGVVAMLADAAMTHCLFVRRISAVTARMTLRFRRPVEVGVAASVRADLVKETARAFVLKARVWQRGSLCAEAKAVFLRQSPCSDQ
jgi:acyl-coenzyme A thioesterase PaaI-like protein